MNERISLQPATDEIQRQATIDGAVDAIVVDAMARSPFPGLALLIEQGGQVIYRKGFGLANVENDVAATADHVFCIGSISKSMTSLCLMQLALEGRVSLDDTIAKYVDDAPDAVGGIKIRHLLNHTSGLQNYSDALDLDGDAQRAFSRADVLNLFIDRPLYFQPGEKWSYCNSGLFLIGLIVEKVTGKTFESYLLEAVFEPFGMSSSRTSDWRPTVRQRASGYRSGGPSGLENAPRFDPIVALGAGGVMTTVDDLLKYRKSLFGPLAAISVDLQARMLDHGSLTDGTALPYTFGCFIDSDSEGRRKVAHSGDINGYASQFAYYPDDDLTIVLLTNNDRGVVPPVSLEKKIARAVLGLPQPDIADQPLDAETAKRFIGDFELFNFYFGFERLGYVFEDGRLNVRVGGVQAEGPLLPLRWQGGDEFVSALDDEQRIVFIPSGDALRLNYYGGVLMAKRMPIIGGRTGGDFQRG